MYSANSLTRFIHPFVYMCYDKPNFKKLCPERTSGFFRSETKNAYIVSTIHESNVSLNSVEMSEINKLLSIGLMI